MDIRKLLTENPIYVDTIIRPTKGISVKRGTVKPMNAQAEAFCKICDRYEYFSL